MSQVSTTFYNNQYIGSSLDTKRYRFVDTIVFFWTRVFGGGFAAQSMGRQGLLPKSERLGVS
jgi:hypothetical protein